MADNVKCSYPGCATKFECSESWHAIEDDHSECIPVCPKHTKVIEFLEKRMLRNSKRLIEEMIANAAYYAKKRDRF